MDGVEIVMAVEDAFDIQITDADAEKMITPRQVIDFVLAKVATTAASVCLTQRAFNLLRRSLLRQGEWNRSAIAPATRVADLIPRSQRRALLEQVALELEINKPLALVRPKWLVAILFAASVLAGLLAVALVLPSLTALAFLIFVVVATLVGSIFKKVTTQCCTEFPKEIQIIGDLARWVMTHKGDLANATAPGWTREQIAARVRKIVVDVLGCKPDFSEDANFVKDLGLS